MANNEHLEIPKTDIQSWYEWQGTQHGVIQLGSVMDGTRFGGADLTNVRGSDFVSHEGLVASTSTRSSCQGVNIGRVFARSRCPGAADHVREVVAGGSEPGLLHAANYALM